MAKACRTGGLLAAVRGLHKYMMTWWRGKQSRLELRGSGSTTSSLLLSLSEPQFLIRKMGLISCPACLPMVVSK